MANSLEQLSIQKYDKQVEAYEQRYHNIFNSIAKSESFHGTLRKNDMYNLGNQIDRYKKYEAFCYEQGGSAAALGSLPRLALDLITASYGLSVAPQLASMQDLDDVEGSVYYKKVFTHGYPMTATKGLPSLPNTAWMNADGTYGEEQSFEGQWKKWCDAQPRPATGPDDTLTPKTMTAKNFDATTFSALKGWVSSPTDYMSEHQIAFVGGGVNTIRNIAFNTRWNMPMRLALYEPNTKKLTELVGVTTAPGQTPKFYGDVNVGVNVVGGTDLVLTIPAGYTGVLTYDIDFEKQPDVPAIEYGLDSMPVTAEIFGVKEELGTFKGFQFHKRFGKSASDEVLQDLSGHMAMAESEKVIQCYVNAANQVQTEEGSGPLTWDVTVPVGISEDQHRHSLLYRILDASAAIHQRSGKGKVNKIIAGEFACTYLASLPGFRAASNTNNIGPQIFGTLENEGITIVRSSTKVATNEILCAWSSEQSPFDAPVVCATYMPVFLTDTIQVANNPFKNQRAIAAWKAIKPVVHQYVQRIVLTRNAGAAPGAIVHITNNPGNGGSNAGSGN